MDPDRRVRFIDPAFEVRRLLWAPGPWAVYYLLTLGSLLRIGAQACGELEILAVGGALQSAAITAFVMLLLAMLIFIKYPLTDKVFQEIRDETEARKLAAITAHHERPEDFVTPDHKV